MKLLSHLPGLLRRLTVAAFHSSLGALVVGLVFFVLYLEGRPALSVWHRAHLDQEFTTRSGVKNLEQYLALEERLFRQLDHLVYDKVPTDERRQINRFTRGSLSDPARWKTNWNRTFILAPAGAPRAGVLLLHGMSDSPYSLRSLGLRLRQKGALVVGPRLPGHGTAPSGLVRATWRDMAAVVRLAMNYLARKAPGRPFYIIGYSNGAALAVNYTLEALDRPRMPKPAALVLLSPAIGVTPVASLAVWQARLGRLLGLEKLEWSSILPEYDPYKYNSFAVNAGDQVYRLTRHIQIKLGELARSGRLKAFPPILAFSSVVDATVEAPALVDSLFDRLPTGRHELVLFDINRLRWMQPILGKEPGAAVQTMLTDRTLPFTLTLVTNVSDTSQQVVARTRRPGNDRLESRPLGIAWPDDIYSLSHLALPFPPDDPLYGRHPANKEDHVELGDLALRGERGLLQISPSDMLRLRWNPFYGYLETRLLSFLNLIEPCSNCSPH